MEKKTTNKGEDTMNKVANFIVTTDEETAQTLIAEGFRFVSNNNGKYTFENKPSEKFSKENSKKVVYTNMLTF